MQKRRLLQLCLRIIYDTICDYTSILIFAQRMFWLCSHHTNWFKQSVIKRSHSPISINIAGTCKYVPFIKKFNRDNGHEFARKVSFVFFLLFLFFVRRSYVFRLLKLTETSGLKSTLSCAYLSIFCFGWSLGVRLTHVFCVFKFILFFIDF